MWSYFSAKHNLVDLTGEQVEMLAWATPQEQGAFIEEFCRGYLSRVRQSLLREKGHASLVSAMKAGVSVSDEEIRSAVTFDRLYQEVLAEIGKKYQGSSNSRRIGFV